MRQIDWLIVLFYLVFTMGIGLYLSRKASKSLADFFVSGRSLPWWLTGASMAATTFSIDTPLLIAGIVGTQGIAGNWLWWSFGISHLTMIYIFARMWRRSEVITDAELTELRYGGRTAAILRGVKAFIFAVPVNCIGIGYAMLGMVKVMDALEIWQGFGFDTGETTLKILSVIGVSIFVLIYCGLAGLWGVVATDFFQFVLALLGAIIVAVIALDSIGGIHLLVEKVSQLPDKDYLAIVPLTWGENGGLLGFSKTAGITLSAFSANIFIQWWAWRRSDGGGEFVQRFAASKDEGEAEKAAWLFNVMHYVVRTWPWIIVALAAVVVFPNLEDKELGYPKLMLEYLSPGLLGLVVASLIAAFMSTVSTSINWGASFITNDLYLRFVEPEASQEKLVAVGRISSVLVTAFGAIAAFVAQDITTVFQLIIAIGTGSGLVLILRWFWWRVNAVAELTAIVSSFFVGMATSIGPLRIEDYGIRVMVITIVVCALWIAVMFLTPPESEATLNEFYRRVRPGGSGWHRQQQQTGLTPAQDLLEDVKRSIAANLLLFGILLSTGGFLLLQPRMGWLSLIVAVGGWMWLRQLNKRKYPPMPRPGSEEG
ncbi:MAG TPA: Na+:solute symporter [Oscillatoriales cyanobacterium M59_W2019_021]|nr:MAG: sodium:proline symporter [Cyanobacteria bacterium J055]HIK31655.1 Na+:solute symporter [Oscillatoriales cyanobacterium M4454_W2019_049]HIK50354.1 Na+:solute symporter [Oscillatoriales cyanobacterium M59_W2019_021]